MPSAPTNPVPPNRVGELLRQNPWLLDEETARELGFASVRFLKDVAAGRRQMTSLQETAVARYLGCTVADLYQEGGRA